MRVLRRNVFVVLASLVAVSLFIIWSSPSGAAETKPQYGGTLRISVPYDGVSIGYPAKMVRAYSNLQAAPALETLFRTDRTGRLTPWLATGLKEDPTAGRVTLTLRKGVKFHDGTDFNAEAMKWNLEQCMGAKSPGTEKLRSIEVVDASTVRINLSEWDNTATSNLAQSIGFIISPAAYKQNGEEWCAKNPVGTGPFEFVSWQKDVRTVYKKFPGYWQKGKPYLDSIVWAPIADTLTQEISLRKGEWEMMLTNVPKSITALEKEGFVVTRQRTGSGAVSIIPDSANPKSPFADVRVRQAAQHAIDTNALVQTIFYGEFEVVNQWIYKGHWGYNPSVAGYPYNPDKARKLLADAGYPKGFKTRILYRTDPESDLLFTAIQGYLKAVGIEADLDPALSARYDQIAFRGGKWEGFIIDSMSANPDLAGALSQRYVGGGTYFASMLAPDDYVKAVQNAVVARDFESKQKWTYEAMKLMIDTYCLQTVLFCRPVFATAKASLQNHGIYETPNTGLWRPEDAWLER
jgi:peptide/nickel transport system substrate-binding protein